MSDKARNQLAAPIHSAVRDQLNQDQVQRSAQTDMNLSPFQKRQLAKQAFRARFTIYQERFNASQKIEKHQLDASVAIVTTMIDVQKDTTALQIRQDYLATLADIGVDVETRQLDFLTDFGVRLKGFRTRLAKKEIDAEEKERILQMSHEAFDRIYNRLMDLADRMAPSAVSPTA